jgi:hypothetical protein
VSRETLPNRRGAEAFDFRHGGFQYRAAIGRFADGRVAEAFIAPEVRSGTLIEGMAHDLAVAASLAFQHGCSAERLRAALTRHDDGSPCSPLGACLDQVALSANIGEGEI